MKESSVIFFILFFTNAFLDNTLVCPGSSIFVINNFNIKCNRDFFIVYYSLDNKVTACTVFSQSKALQEWSSKSQLVVATGGGAVLHPINWYAGIIGIILALVSNHTTLYSHLN